MTRRHTNNDDDQEDILFGFMIPAAAVGALGAILFILWRAVTGQLPWHP